jgi:cell wall-associated NlpC family hydrolase
MPRAPGADVLAVRLGSVVSRIAALICCFAALPAAALAAAPADLWAQPQVNAVIRSGLFDATPATFDPSAPLSRAALADAVARLTDVPASQVGSPGDPVSIEELDAALVRAVGLGDASNLFYLGASDAGLDPPARFGTEAVARLLGLRLDHPAGQESLELQPQDTAPRAEAAYSLARILRLHLGGGDLSPTSVRRVPGAAALNFSQAWDPSGAQSAAQSFTLPVLTAWQRQILTTAVSYIGYPYVWGGTLDHAVGFDCSGFVWQVYKLTQYEGGGALAATLRGRTTMAMSRDVPRTERIGLTGLQPGDVLFFGRGPRSKPKEIDHAGIYLGNGWFIHASGVGVAVAQLDGLYQSSFAWARRPLAEAGLA